jgi:uncharacterized protein YndB with AHSA1/START domain
MNTDRIQKEILLRAPAPRVWKALSDSAQFGAWFGMKMNGVFVPGATLRGTITGTEVDDEVAAMQKPYEGTPIAIIVERMEPERLFSFRWHPYSVEPGVDYDAEPTTLVEFEMTATAEGVRLVVTESGFDALPEERRAKAFAANDGGWTLVIQLVAKYLAREASRAA